MASYRSSPLVKLALLAFLLSFLALGAGIFAVHSALDAAAARAARATALAVRQVLRRPEVPALFPGTCRFSLGPEGLRVPRELGWYSTPPSPPPPTWRERLILEKVREFRTGRIGRKEARPFLQELEDDPSRNPRERLAAAWLAQALEEAGTDFSKDKAVEDGRRGFPGFSLTAGTKALGRKAPPPSDTTFYVSFLLLQARRGIPPPGWTEDLLPRLPAARGRALASRLAELVPVPEDRFRRWEKILDRAEALRRLLRKIHSLQAELARARGPLVRPLGKEVLLYHPLAQGGGSGVLVDREVLLKKIWSLEGSAPGAPGLSPPEGSGKPWFGSDPPEGAAPLWEGAWIVPGGAFVSGSSGSWLPWALIPVLGLPLLFGLLLALRAARREWDAFQARSEFLTSVTHQLKTPLSSIRLFAEMLQEGKASSPGKARLYLDLLAAETGRLASMVENVLDLKRLERGERTCDLRPLDLGDFARQAMEILRPLAEREGLRLEADLPGEKVEIRADREALLQVFFNLFENVRSFAREGGLFRLEVERGQNGPVLRVLDRGPGVPPAEREALFEPFRRGSLDRAGTARGVGLGLALSRRILRAHGGDMVCPDPPPGFGACFELTFPQGGKEGPAMEEGKPGGGGT